ncbi:Gfo/Idh/MocA family oxidoreductase [Sneathiella marina]|uniref:Gfo/Idh/MocA family oxidoreductase n=1 Tax=Sneathiella marina TaxID=2950108 RepID=A0ABY4W6B6_9PROT|nr:Gfo/Idh/MocA family oxidoreductase [Sneathiella marina]USG62598.1 Gfo/Idh/MocA family oxidoreductase [Sneathiella marina]
MNLHHFLKQRAENNRPIGVALIGAGKFATMFLTQARLTTGMHIVGIAELAVTRGQAACVLAGWPSEQIAAQNLDDAAKNKTTFITEDVDALIAHPSVEVVIDATGNPHAGVAHCLKAISNGKHIIMVNVEADALAGPLLARKAQQAGVVYSLAWGDQPALICEHVDWARACGFTVTCAGKGTRYLPRYHELTPDTVWDTLKVYLDVNEDSDINPKMFNSFLDGTKSGIEMTAVCNATGLVPQADGLSFPPASRFDLADTFKPQDKGGTLTSNGTTEVASSLFRDGTDVPAHLVMGTFVVIEGESEYARECFKQYHMLPDKSHHYAALYRPTHMIGMELGISVAAAACRNEATGAPICFNSDVVSIAKRDLKAGEILDGEGGFMVWGKQMPAASSMATGGLPLGLASGIRLKHSIAKGSHLTWQDVDIDENDPTVRFRREMEAAFALPNI